MLKHTSGPWIEGKDKYGPFVVFPLPKSSFRSAMPSLEVARIVATSPELLAWTKAYLVLLEGLVVSPANKEQQFFAHTTLQLMINRLKQTIAKATGGESC